MKLELATKAIRPLSFWSWNGSMEKEETLRQINDLHAQGFGGFFIHSRAGLEIEYMSDQWFEACSFCVERAKELDMDVYIYDEDGWPSGFAGGVVTGLGEDYWFKQLDFASGLPDVPRHRILAAYQKSGDEYQRIPLNRADSESLCIYYTTDPYYVDLVYEDTVQQFIKSTHEVYKSKLGGFFGSVIKGVFTDEPQLSSHHFHWSKNLPAEFEARNGYSLLDKLWLLKVTGQGYQKLRHDYYKTLNAMMIDYFTKPLSGWCAQNGLSFTGHYASEDGLCTQILSNGGVMAHYEHVQIPGIDHLGRRITSPLLVKQVTSVANQMGARRVISETYGCSGWDISFQELAWIWGWQAANGINLPCFHLSAYSIKGVRKRDYPAFYSYQSPWFERLHLLVSWMNTINSILYHTKSANRVLVLSPVTGYWCVASEAPFDAQGTDLSNQYRLLCENLLGAQIPFDLGDETVLLHHGKIKDKTLHICEGCYDTVIVAQTPSLEPHTIALLTEFQKSGGSLLFVNEFPQLVAGEPEDGVLQNLAEASVPVIQNREAIFEKYFSCVGFERDVQVFEPNGRQPASELVATYRKGEKQDYIILFNRLRGAQTRELLLKLPANCAVSKFDAAQNDFTPLESSRSNGYTFVKISVGEFECAAFAVHGEAGSVKSAQNKKTVALQDFAVRVLDKNALTIDYASYTLDGCEPSPVMPTIKMQEILYQKAAQFSRQVCAKIDYCFDNRTTASPRLYLCAETDGISRVLINGKPLTAPPCGFYVDKSIYEYEITEFVCAGQNHIQFEYQIPQIKDYINVDEIYETERNRFAYPFEIESIYITGDFDVAANAAVSHSPDHHRLKNASFFLCDRQKKHADDLTVQNMWFYRGDVAYATQVKKPAPGCSVQLQLENCSAVLCDILINGTYALSLAVSPLCADITRFLTNDNNTLEIIARGHNRNLLGPHHHIKGQCYFVGLSTFKGIKGYEDFVSPEITDENTWTDDYSFVPFSIGRAFLKYYQTGDETEEI